MEVKETAACGISLREFAIEFDTDEIGDIYRVLNYAHNGVGSYEEDFLEDLKAQMAYIIGPSLEEEPPEGSEEETIHWEDTGASYNLSLNELEGAKLLQILNAVEHPGEGFDKEMNQRLLDQMMEMAPGALQSLAVTYG